jgi:hypothetical protein
LYSSISDQPHRANYFIRSYSVWIFTTSHSFYLFIYFYWGVGGRNTLMSRPECHLEVPLKTDQMNALEFLCMCSFSNTNCIRKGQVWMSMRVGAAMLEVQCFAVCYWHCIWHQKQFCTFWQGFYMHLWEWDVAVHIFWFPILWDEYVVDTLEQFCNLETSHLWIIEIFY